MSIIADVTHLLTYVKTGQGESYSPGFKVPDRNENTAVLENIRKLAEHLKTSPGVMENIDQSYLSDLKKMFNKVIDDRNDMENDSIGTCGMTASRHGVNDTASISIATSTKPAVVSPDPYKKKHNIYARNQYSSGYSGNTTKLYYFVIGTYVVVYFSKGSATGGLGWFRDPQNKIQGELLTKDSLGSSESLTSTLNIRYVLPLRDRELTLLEKPMEFPWKAGRKLYSFAFIHENPQGSTIGEEYASDYAKNFIAVIMKHFPSYKIYMGGSVVQETGEAISSLDDIFMKNDVAGFISKCYKEQIDDGSFFETRNMNEYIRRHPNPEALVKYVHNMQFD